MEPEKTISKKFSIDSMCRAIWHFLTKNIFPPFLADILNYSIKCKNTFILQMVRNRVIFTTFSPQEIHRAICHFLPKTILTPLLVAILKMQNAFISKTVHDRAIRKKILTLCVYAESFASFCQNCFPAIFVVIWNFCVILKKGIY